MSDLSMNELREQAKARGINTFQMSKEQVAAALANPPREGRETDRREVGRRARVPLGTMTQKMSSPRREGYVRYWFNDAGSRIHDASMAGYEHVEESVDGRQVKVSRRVGTNEDGSPLIAHLMEIRQEFYDEDQGQKQRAVDEIDAAIKGGEPRAQDAESGRYYTPSEGVSVRSD